ncbi:hypothetical protein BCR44DRAFT_1440638 [Catenaria anguillulae PL171]|uniref:Uncharacterized protein n=1 Tax=Catenaria anguillulae PL171 TaxID=765915 RepID=A0A1Y2HCR1_9FUNG|nr:hypothetical protein BCR44DRAFT_1440638 [Catenaria anguillulae PL171]
MPSRFPASFDTCYDPIGSSSFLGHVPNPLSRPIILLRSCHEYHRIRRVVPHHLHRLPASIASLFAISLSPPDFATV